MTKGVLRRDDPALDPKRPNVPKIRVFDRLPDGREVERDGPEIEFRGGAWEVRFRAPNRK